MAPLALWYSTASLQTKFSKERSRKLELIGGLSFGFLVQFIQTPDKRGYNQFSMTESERQPFFPFLRRLA